MQSWSYWFAKLVWPKACAACNVRLDFILSLYGERNQEFILRWGRRFVCVARKSTCKWQKLMFSWQRPKTLRNDLCLIYLLYPEVTEGCDFQGGGGIDKTCSFENMYFASRHFQRRFYCVYIHCFTYTFQFPYIIHDVYFNKFWVKPLFSVSSLLQITLLGCSCGASLKQHPVSIEVQSKWEAEWYPFVRFGILPPFQFLFFT